MIRGIVKNIQEEYISIVFDEDISSVSPSFFFFNQYTKEQIFTIVKLFNSVPFDRMLEALFDLRDL